MTEKIDKGFVAEKDSVLVSDLLYFMWSKLKSTAVKTVVTICHQFYTDDDYVLAEKKKLCIAIGDSANSRRSENKRMKSLEDICAMMTGRDLRGDFLPTFASINLNNVPITADGNPTLGQILASLTDLKKNSVSTEMLKRSLHSLKDELSTPSSSLQSLPVTESLACPDVTTAASCPLTPSAPTLSQFPEDPPSNISTPTPNSSETETSSGVPHGDELAENSVAPRHLESAPHPNNPRHAWSVPHAVNSRPAPHPDNCQASMNRQRQTGNGSNKRRRDPSRSRPTTIIGKNVKEGLTSVKGADLTVNRYVGRFHNESTTEGVRKFIADQGVKLEDLETKHGRYKSFRLRVKRSELAIIENEEFWPSGVILSPFFRPKRGEIKVDGAIPAIPS